MTEKEVLEKARELLTPEGAWIQNELAIATDGGVTWVGDSAACGWCLLGAIDHAAHVAAHAAGIDGTAHVAGIDDPELLDFVSSASDAALEKIRQVDSIAAIPSLIDGIAAWNDDEERTHAEVLALLDRAIAAAA